MSSVSLNAALSGLQIAQQQINTISNNVANATTPGYTRKILPQETQVIDGQSVGVLSENLTRVVNEALIGDVNQQTSATNYTSVQQSYFQQIQDSQGSPTGGTSLNDQLTQLASAFSQLSQSPNDPTLLSQALTDAQQTTSQINSYANQLNGLRAQSESDITAAVAQANQDLSNIASLNVQISNLAAEGQNTADLQDQRDAAINDLSQYMQVTTTTQGQMLQVATPQGQVLANATAQKLYFSQSNMLPSSYYPGGGLSGITIGSPTGTDIAAGGSLSGQLGGLLNLRDQVLPQYQAQLDEFSQKLASRFNDEGLALFTDGNGNVPADTAPPAAPAYVGFSSLIQVNPAITNNPGLIQQGTSGPAQPAGSDEVINRINMYAFGNTQYQQATGSVDISGGGSLETMLGLTTDNNVVGTVNIAAYAPDLSTLPGVTGFPATFTIQLGAGAPQVITINGTDTAAAVASKINTAVGSNVASINGNGDLALDYKGDITLTDGGQNIISAFGLPAGTTAMPDPTFTVQVGTQSPVTISIAPADTSATLLAKLNAVSGLTASLNGSGYLVMTPTEGGALSVIDTDGGPLAAMGVTTANVAFSSFRQSNVGPGGNLSTGLLADSTLQNYISGAIANQSEAANVNKTQTQNQQSYLTTLTTRNQNTSGVNIDQEMTSLIQVQSAYTAAAKLITATQSLFTDLLSAFP
ncbi:MAG: flagellar hook-associated protein FlgK [Alphaproteobacteria bacterium]|nr:flagellar hook-associated protein FlgK [Alphaproteobacteria bacterium]MDE2335988.1 flagellar hook-associated protein FlgK [Alphaproteobacteria bacterium]